MEISAKTKISELINFNPLCIDAIASINKHFLKLKNPVLRKILASRVTIADAAKIGHSTVEEFYKRLKPLGFDKDCTTPEENIQTADSIKPVLKWKERKVTTLDVRSDLQSGKDPFQKIMSTIKSIPIDTVLCVINSFVPFPLINILNRKGFEHYVHKDEDGVVYTYFKLPENKNEKKVIKEPATSLVETQSFDEMVRLYKNKMEMIDVREMGMPFPMIAILKALEKLPEGFALFVQHKRVPQFLLVELKERHFNFLLQEIGELNVQMLIFK